VCIFLVGFACVWDDTEEQYADVDTEKEPEDNARQDPKFRMVP
jgi:hypothetical protein